MIRCFKSNRGSVFILVFLVMIVLIFFGISILSIAIADTKMTNYQEDSLKAYYLAQSGARTLADYVVKSQDVNEIKEMVEIGQSEPIQIGDGSFILDVSKSGSELIIKSTGTVNGVSRIVSVVLEKSRMEDLSNFTIFSMGDINIKPNAVVNGTVATNYSKSEGHNIKGFVKDIEYNAGIELPKILMPDTFDQIEDNTISSDWNYHVQGEKYVYFKNGVDFKSNDKLKEIRITGNGILHLYVSGGWNSNKASLITAEPGVILNIYIIDASNIIFGSHRFNGIIYAPNSNFSNKNADKGRILNGVIIAKSVDITNHTTVNCDPDVNFYTLTIDASNDYYRIKEWR